jgi:plasmid stabilization system protein ParE
LAQLPRRGVFVAGRAEYRRILYKPWFLIYFRINESFQLIEVVRIWDARQDPTTLMLD